MSPQNKRDLGEAMTWILRLTTAVGAFFLILLVNEIKDMHRDVEAILRAQAVTDEKLKAHDARITDLQRRAPYGTDRLTD